ncbi:MAG TPA: exodeoxyribonuclease VII large subunit [Clostridiaceae bacterium]|nr:exodeoxyribonuclease VII large subunit [Clostridiaceae bacterium]
MAILSVSEVNKYAARLLTRDALLSSLQVEGEISGGKIYSSGHYYFTLKDSKAQISCVCFRSAMSSLKFRPEDGQHVIVLGYATIYEQGGRYQIVVRTMQQAGEGLLYAKFVELRDRLAASGLFAEERKKPLPYLPNIIGIITSPEGAVIRDIIHILRRRFPGFKIKIFPVSVQGPSSAAEIVSALSIANRYRACDVLIVCRGGGSLEDLMSFNSEEVALAVAASAIPVISAVGHETDYTICDFVADLRAPTPSAAAELVLPLKSDLYNALEKYRVDMRTSLQHRLALARNKMRNLIDRPVLKQPAFLVSNRAQRLDLLVWRLKNQLRLSALAQPVRFNKLKERLLASTRDILLKNAKLSSGILDKLDALLVNKLETEQKRLIILNSKLRALDPNAVVRRGYARINSSSTGQIISSVKQLAVGLDISIHLADGVAAAKIEDLKHEEMLD